MKLENNNKNNCVCANAVDEQSIYEMVNNHKSLRKQANLNRPPSGAAHPPR
jgi:hypothetical protein